MPETYPLTPGQERIWLSEQRYPGTSLNHLVGCYRLEGTVDTGVLVSALRQVAAAHATLRTGFADHDGQPFATVHPHVEPVVEVVEVVDVSDGDEVDCFGQAYAHAVEAARRPFDLSQPGLLRATLCRFGPQQQLLTLVIHHLIADGTGASILIRDVSAAYQAVQQGRSWSPPAPPMPYADHVAEERARAGSDAERAGLDYWRGELAGAPPALDLATDLSRPSRRSPRTHSHASVLWGDELSALRRLARSARASPTLVLAAAWAATLSRLSGQDDIVLGMAVSRRDRPETAGLVASLMNVLPLRIRLTAGDTLPDLVRQVRGKLLAGLAHQDVPLQRIVEHLAPERVAGLMPIVQVLFNQDAAGAGLDLAEVSTEPVALDVPAGMDLDLELSVVSPADHQELRLTLRGATDLFREATSRGMLAQFVTLLRDGLARPEAAVADLALIGPAEQAAIAQFATGPAPANTGVPAAPAAIERRTRQHPDAPAVVTGAGTVSYAELHRQAAGVAARLAAAGVQAGDLVAIYAHRSVALLAGMLGAWRARAGYLPVDPEYPRRRVEFLLQDSGAAAVLTTGDLTGGLPAGLGAPVITIDDASPGGDGSPAEFPAPPRGSPAPPQGSPSGDDVAYVVYTSGSTGVPKGVRVSHRSLANLLEAVARETGMGSETVMLAVTSPSFDIAAVELFGPLCTGGAIVLAAPGEELDPPRLADVVSQHRVTMVQATPASWQQLTGVLAGRARLRQAICAGEPLSQDLARRICQVAETVWNGYGPSETTIYSLWHRVDPEAGERMTPIGRPVAGTTAHVVDDRLRPQPLGVPGELLLGGVGVARGYHRRPELTAQRFIESPSGGGPVYRTGDVVRLRHDGVFEFRGRRDNQVKLRGHRIELDEIAETLRRHPGVADAVVTVRPDRKGELQLVAYVAAATTRNGSGDD